jgi:hypothetical protein
MSIADVAIAFALSKDGWFESRFLTKTQRDEATGCLLWTGSKNAGGYGLIMVTIPNRPGRPVAMLAHRVAFAQAKGVGALPPGKSGLTREKLVIDHKCNQRACVEPSHLRTIPQGLNYWRGLQRTDHAWMK